MTAEVAGACYETGAAGLCSLGAKGRRSVMAAGQAIE